jgi:predicted nucleotidyltransferase
LKLTLWLHFYYYYGPVFFERAGVDLDSYSIQAILGGVSLAMVIPAMWTIEHVGRRKVSRILDYFATFDANHSLI